MLASLRVARALAERSPGLASMVVIAVAAVLLRGIPFVSALGMVLVFFLPGSSLVSSLVPRATMASWEMTVTSVGVSLALVIATGLLLNMTPGGLDPTAWSALLAAITIVSALVAMIRRHAMGAAAERGDRRGAISSPLKLTLPRRHEAWQIAAALGLALIVVGATRIMVASRPAVFTQLWMTGTAQPGAVELGVRNAEGTPETYLLRLHSAEATYPSIEFGLGSDEVWTRTLQIDPGAGGEVTADLYRLPNRSAPYRHVTLAPAPPSP